MTRFPEQPCRQSGRRVLHPPGAVVVAGQSGNLAGARRQAQRAGWQHGGAELLGPGLGIGLDAEVERRVAELRLGDGPGRVLAIGGRPGAPQPVRCVEPRGVLAGKHRLALARQAAQHGVDQGAVGGERLAAGLLDAGVDRGVGRRVQEQQLAGAEAQQGLQPRLGRLERPLEAGCERGVDLAQAPQGRGDQGAREGPVAGLQPGQPGMAGQHLVECPAAAKDGTEDLPGDGTRVRGAGSGLRLGHDPLM